MQVSLNETTDTVSVTREYLTAQSLAERLGVPLHSVHNVVLRDLNARDRLFKAPVPDGRGRTQQQLLLDGNTARATADIVVLRQQNQLTRKHERLALQLKDL